MSVSATTIPDPGFGGPIRFVRDTALLTARSLRAIPRVPERLGQSGVDRRAHGLHHCEHIVVEPLPVILQSPR